MSRKQKLAIGAALRRAVLGGMGLLVAMPAIAQEAAEATDDALELKPIVVTGSWIPRTAVEGPSPVAVVTASEIQKLGSSDILQALKRISPSLGGNLNVGQELNNGGFGESNIALRNQPTLVLLNGRRLGNSSFSNGQLVDLNTIPLAAIERVELLKDGASAIYGSEAVGGVVNIITKADYSGTEIGGRFGGTTSGAQYHEYGASIVGGIVSEKARFTAGAQFYYQDPLKTSDRSISSLDAAELAAAGVNPASKAYFSPSFDGITQTGGQRYILRGHPLLQGTPDYDPTLVTPPVFSGQTFNTVGDYNAFAQANGFPNGVYVPTGAILNATDFGTHAIQSQQRANFFGDGEYDLYGKQVQVYGTFLYSNIESEGALAPAPVVGLAPKQANINIPAENPYNPFGIDLGPSGSLAPRIRSRFIDNGNRLFQSQTDYFHFVGGLKGEFATGFTWDAGYTYNRYNQVQYTRNAVNGAALDLALQPNADPVLAAQGLSQYQASSGAYVPVYNLFSIAGQNDPTTLNSIRTTLFQTGVSEESLGDFRVSGKAFNLPAGEAKFAAGGGFGSASLQIDVDGLTQAGKVPGLTASDPTEGRRDSWAAFVEMLFPITSPEQGIAGLHRLEVTAAGRYEDFDPGGDAPVPKVGVKWHPFGDSLMLRGSYSQSFVAPTTFELFGGSEVSVPFLLTPDNFAQETTTRLSNSTLESMDAENFGGGVVYSPEGLKGLTLSIDYYHLKTENEIFRVSEQAMLNDLNANGSNSRWQPNYFFDDGTQLTTATANQVLSATWGVLNVPLLNGAQSETDGFDLTARYFFATESIGNFDFWANANLVLNYEYQDPVSGGPFSYDGQYTDAANGYAGAQGTLPEYVINAGVIWDTRIGENSFGISLNGQYIPEVDDLGSLHPSNLDFELNADDGLNDFTISGGAWTVDSYFRLDGQVFYEIGRYRDNKAWYDGTRIALGMNNITDTDPPLIASAFEDNTDKSTYDILGPFVYMTVSKRF